MENALSPHLQGETGDTDMWDKPVRALIPVSVLEEMTASYSEAQLSPLWLLLVFRCMTGSVGRVLFACPFTAGSHSPCG